MWIIPKSLQSKIAGSRNPNWKGGKVKRFCEYCGKEFYVSPAWLRKQPCKFCSGLCYGKWRGSVIRGKKNPAWKGGKTSELLVIRTSAQYEEWRNAVFARDNYTCRNCGDMKGGNLNAHHIKSFTHFEQLRFELSNGITLCKICHKEEHLKRYVEEVSCG